MRIFTSLHILLLAYVVAALVFWGFSLERQSISIFEQQRMLLASDVDSVKYPQLYHQHLDDLIHKKEMRTKQYIGEGTTFLLVILIGAAVVYSSFRRRLLLSKQQNNFMLSVTHELKSPLAAIKLNLQTLAKHKLDAEKQGRLLERCLLEADRLNDLTGNLLLASQIEGKRNIRSAESFNFSEMVEDSISDYASRYPKRFEEDIETDCQLTGDRTMLQMAINNLLENAVKYTPEDKAITIKLNRKADAVVLQVIDEGPGIAEEEKRKVFNKFYRIGNEETRKTKGTGLGLYLTGKIVGQHRGRILIKDNKPQGAIFEVSLPIA
jgi:signal transduction histidine kinase